MNTREEKIKMRKRNMKLFPIYKRLAWDYLFYYTIDFLFLTQVKNLSAADVVLSNSIKALFGIFLQIPANIIVEYLGRRNSIILGNILNCVYIVLFIMTGNLLNLIVAKFISSLAFSIKNIAEPSLLNESIPNSKYKSSIFAEINAKGYSGYFILGAISKIIAGFLFEINGYIPMVLSLIVLVIVCLISIFYIEPLEKTKKIKGNSIIRKQIKDIDEGFKFALKSERLKALILAASLIASLLAILTDYQVSLLQDIGITASVIGYISAGLSIVSAIASNLQDKFNDKFKNKTISIIALMLSISTMLAGIVGINNKSIFVLTVIIILYTIARFMHGMYYTIIERYFRNFTNEDIDTKIFAVKNLFVNAVTALMGFFASFLINKMKTAYCMIIIGLIFTVLYLFMRKYMEKRVGLKPEEYSKEERKYDELKMEGIQK